MIASPRRIAGSLATLLVMAACAASERPARLAEFTPEGHEEIARTVASALNDSSVRLTADVMLDDGELIVERARHVDGDGRRVMGREFTPPAHFRLLVRGTACWLEHVETERRFRLRAATCVAMPEGGNLP